MHLMTMLRSKCVVLSNRVLLFQGYTNADQLQLISLV